MKKSTHTKVFSMILLVVMILSMLPMTISFAIEESVGQVGQDTIPCLISGDGESSSRQVEVITFTEDLVPRYGSNGKFLAPIEDSDPTAIPISTAEQLNSIRTSLNGNYVLVDNIDLADWGEWMPIGDNSTNDSSSRFTGTFDGQGFIIKNMTIIGNTYKYAGLFGYAQNATIKNVGMEGSTINALGFPSSIAGGICGCSPIYGSISTYISILNCYNTGNISSSLSAGGILGDGYSDISNCYNTGKVSVHSSREGYAGGIYSYGDGTVSNCYNTGNVSADASDFSYAGGICSTSGGTISNCYNNGDVFSYSSSDYSCAGGIYGSGGIFGFFISSASNCYNIGSVSASSYQFSYAGGICGTSGWHTSNCYNTGNISAFSASDYSNTGGICGLNYSYFSIFNCYNTGDVSSSSTSSSSHSGGICGVNTGDNSIFNCYNIGDVYAISDDPSYAGGIYGYGLNVSVSDCVVISKRIYAESSNSSVYSHLIGYGGTRENNLAVDSIQGNILVFDDSDDRITLNEAKSQTTYEERLNWDFDDVWVKDPDYDFPQLQGLPYYQPKTEPTYTVTFSAGEHGTMIPVSASEEIPYGRTVTSVPAITAAPGYVFTGWKSSIGGVYDNTAILLYPVNGAMTFTAQYDIIISSGNATAVFVYNGGEDETGDTTRYKSGLPGAAYEVPNPERTGYIFSGWLPKDPGIFSIAGSITIYAAQWTPKNYIVTFRPGENGTISSGKDRESISYGSTVTGVPGISASIGSVFIGWKCSKNESIYIESGVKNYIVTEDVTFTALYADAADATVIFFYNGGTKGILVSSYESGRSGTAYDVPEPDKVGYTPSGWLDGTPSKIFGAAGSITHYTAQWRPNASTVRFSPGEKGSMADPEYSENVLYGEKVSGVPRVTSNTGYVFIGWECSENGSIYDEIGVKSYSVITDLTFTALYAEVTDATVIFFYDGGIADGFVSSYTRGAPGMPYTVPEPIKTGYTLTGWSPALTGNTFGTTGSIIDYTAQWTPASYTVTFYAGSNGKMEPESYSKIVSHNNNVISVPAITADSGYTHQGWSMNGSSTSYKSIDIPYISITGDTDFVAQYQRIVSPGGGSTTMATLTVKGIDKVTGAVIYNQGVTVVVGSDEKINAPIISGYVLDTDSPISQSIIIKTGTNTVNFYYKYIGEQSEHSTGNQFGQQNRLPAGAKVKEALETEEHIPYINGYPDGSVRPNDKITRAEVAMIFWRLLKTSAKHDVVTNSFNDIKGGESHAQAVNYLAGINILQGYKDGSFRPFQGITRAEFTAIASRFDDLAIGNSNPFSDLTSSHWAYDYIISAYTKSWISGYPNGEFRPQNSISRAEAVKTVNCMLGRGIKPVDLPEDIPSYTDISDLHWAYCEIMEATVSHQCERKANGWETWK
ncbi:MAG: S-layer homology domain-containing protein [Clostridiales bacterium]|jgi:hypothetical protein|nr:S-layer homology domain-containing protein [Clostridiales bacterium]